MSDHDHVELCTITAAEVCEMIKRKEESIARAIEHAQQALEVADRLPDGREEIYSEFRQRQESLEWLRSHIKPDAEWSLSMDAMMDFRVRFAPVDQHAIVKLVQGGL